MTRSEDAVRFVKNRQTMMQDLAVLKAATQEDLQQANRIYEIYHVLLMKRDMIPKVEKLLGIKSA